MCLTKLYLDYLFISIMFSKILIIIVRMLNHNYGCKICLHNQQKCFVKFDQIFFFLKITQSLFTLHSFFAINHTFASYFNLYFFPHFLHFQICFGITSLMKLLFGTLNKSTPPAIISIPS